MMTRKSTRRCKVLIVDEQTIMRDGLYALLAADADYQVVGTIEESKLVLDYVRELSPDVVIADPGHAGSADSDTIASLKEAEPGIRVIALTRSIEDDDIHSALKAGADAYVLKDDSQAELFSALARIKAGEKYLSPTVAERVIMCFVVAWETQRKLSSPDVLTPRERDIVRLIAKGRRTREIAEHFSLSPKTVDKHRTNLMRKLGLRSISAVTVYAMQNGLVDKQ